MDTYRLHRSVFTAAVVVPLMAVVLVLVDFGGLFYCNARLAVVLRDFNNSLKGGTILLLPCGSHRLQHG